MKNKIIFKTLMLKGEAGSTIVSMEKTGHVGTADIYTITFNDGSTTEISLENMSAITSVEKTSSTDTEDIYTITCADGSTQTFSVVNHNADIAAMSDDIDTIDARVDNFINSVVPNTIETLWTGSISQKNDSATLSKAVSNFDYIDLYLLGSADSKYIRVPATQTVVQIQQQNLSDDASSNFLRLWEMGVSISGSTVSITKSIAWAWDDPDNSHPTATADAQNAIPITRIDGVKIASDTPAEVTDIRVGADGKTYNSAGAAVRGQISDLKSDLSQITEPFPPNLFDKDAIVTGALMSDGSISSVTDIWTSDFIKVDGADFVVSFATRPNDGYIRVGWYDSNKTFVSRLLFTISATKLYNLIQNTNNYPYVRISVQYGPEDTLQLELGDVATAYQPYSFTAIDKVARKELNTKYYDVCIVGGGAAGVACGYALKDSGLKTCIIEAQDYLGGTHTNAYVNCMAYTPSPSFLKNLTHDQINKGQACISIGEHNPLSKADALALDWKRTYKYNYYLIFNPRALALKYYADLAATIDIMTGKKVISVEKTANKVISVTLNDGTVIYANQFIDCSASQAILSVADGELIYGGDSATRYQANYGFTEEHGYTENYDFCNCTTIIYRIAKGTEDLSNVSAAYYDGGAYWYHQDDPEKVYINTVQYIGPNTGIQVITDGPESVYNSMKNETIRQWKTIKNGYMVGKLPSPITDYKFDQNAPMLGIRESYRTLCERMLHESILYDRLYLETIDRIADGNNNLDKCIAIGSYYADLFNDPHISAEDLAEINSGRIQNYMVSYGCIVPKNYTNLLVASRGAGFTHIAASSFRLTKNIMQLGWAAGWATRLLNENELTDYRDVDVETLQTDEYAGIRTMVYDLLNQ